MLSLVYLAINIIDPFGIIRNYIVKPIFDVSSNVYVQFREKTNDGVSSAKDIAVKTTIILFAAAIIIWASIFMYIAFYYTYMPAIAHVRPVHMQFKVCPDESCTRSFPKAHVSLTKRQQILMIGQPYRIFVYIDMPESSENQNLGMFMVCAEMRDQFSNLQDHSCRSTMLTYKSPLVRTITTWVFSPLYVFGLKEERQQIPVELFSHYEDEHSHPVTDVYLEIQSNKVQFYGVTLQITAHFTGLRYIMFHWPILSATVGISTNLFFILIVSILSWYHWGETIEGARFKLQQRVDSKSILDTYISTPLDESSALNDDDERTFNNRSDDDIEELFAENISEEN